MGEGRSPKRKQGLWFEKGVKGLVEVNRNDPSSGKWQDQVSNASPFLSPRTTGRWMTPKDTGAPCQAGSRKNTRQSLRMAILTQELWEFLATWPLNREQIHSFPGPYTTVRFMEVGCCGVLRVPGRFSPCKHVGSETE